MEEEYGDVRGKCVDCFGCGRQECPAFKGVLRCDDYIKYIKNEKENIEDEKI